MLNAKHFFFSVILLCVALTACTQQDSTIDVYDLKLYEPQYASGFEIRGKEGSPNTLVITRTPWQGADSLAQTMLYISRDGEPASDDFKGQVLNGDAKRIVCMSSSYVAMLDALGEVQRVAGVSGIDFISNPYIQSHRQSIGDVGYDGNINYERLLSLDPDMVLLYGVAGASTITPKLEELGIPYMYVGEYLEEDPLGKAEWLVAIGEVLGMRDKAALAFSEIPQRYNDLREKVMPISYAPTVMVNTPYRDSWVMPSTSSYQARLIRDAGGSYVYDKNTSNVSLPIDMEEAYQMAAHATCWVNVGAYSSLGDLKRDFPKFADLDAVKQGNVWNTTLRQTPAGGNDYWESGVVHPDSVLQDLINIFHPGLLTDTTFTYYQRLTE